MAITTTKTKTVKAKTPKTPKKSKSDNTKLALLDLLEVTPDQSVDDTKDCLSIAVSKTPEEPSSIVLSSNTDPKFNLAHTLTYKPLDYSRPWITIPIENDQARNVKRSIENAYRYHGIKVAFK